ncbi:ABC transporter permease [Limimaricola pyoseonensis]|nr:ABC transporter permease [Limimaricola pyoseonensis]
MSSLPLARPRMPRRRFASMRAIMALILREMSTRYGRSPGGYLWAVLEPVAGIALLTLVFAAAFRSPPLGTNFAVFYATGMVPFLIFTGVQGTVAGALNYSRQLLAYPTVTYLDALLARFALNFMTQLMVAYIVLGGCILIFDTRLTLNLPVIIEAFALTGLLSLGIGTLNCYLFSRSNIFQQVWSILMRPAFIVSGVFFLFEAIPEPYSDYLWFNPLIHVLGLMRRGFYSTYDATYVSVTFVVGVSLTCLALGLLLLWRFHAELLDR